MSIPTIYPDYIKNIPDSNEKANWQSSYQAAYTKEYNQYNTQWNDLKAVMSSVATFALTLFPSIILIAQGTAVTVAASLTLFSIGTAGAVCLGLFFGIYQKEYNQNHQNSMPTTFPQKFAVIFNQAKV